MKKISGYLCAVLLSVLFFSSCKKGDAGPAGPMGNADVKMFTFTEKTFAGVVNYEMLGLTQGFVDSSIVLVYYTPSVEATTSWYPCPGIGSGGSYETRYLLYKSSISPEKWTVSLRVMKTDGSGPYTTPITFNRAKIIFAPASSIQAGRGTPLDLNDYNAVKNYYNLPD